MGLQRIYIIGDSISIQYGPYLQQYLNGFMDYARKDGEAEALLNLDRPQGANGGDSSMVLDFLQAAAATRSIRADILLLNCGLHDIKTDPVRGTKQVSLDAYTRNLQAMVPIVQQTLGIKLAWIRTTPCDEKVHNASAQMAFHRYAADCLAYNAAADAVMAAAGVPMIDLHTFTLNLAPDLYCDHVHFTDPVRRLQAAFIAGWLTTRDAQPGLHL